MTRTVNTEALRKAEAHNIASGGQARSGLSNQLAFSPIPFAGEPRDLLKLAHGVEPSPLLAVADDLKAVALQLWDTIQLGGGCVVQVDHTGRSQVVSAIGGASQSPSVDRGRGFRNQVAPPSRRTRLSRRSGDSKGQRPDLSRCGTGHWLTHCSNG